MKTALHNNLCKKSGQIWQMNKCCIKKSIKGFYLYNLHLYSFYLLLRRYNNKFRKINPRKSLFLPDFKEVKPR